MPYMVHTKQTYPPKGIFKFVVNSYYGSIHQLEITC